MLDVKRVSETKFIAQTLKKIIMFDYTKEGFEKLMRFRTDPVTQVNGKINHSACQMPPMIVFPFYDPWDLPYIIGEQLRIYDTRTKQQELMSMEDMFKASDFV